MALVVFFLGRGWIAIQPTCTTGVREFR